VLAAQPPPVAVAAQARLELHAYRVTAAAGSEHVQFAGDPAAGCADRGVCGVSGSLTFSPVRPEPGSTATLIRTGSRVSGQAVFSGGNVAATVGTAGTDKPCSDAFFARQSVITFRRLGARRVQAILHGPVGEPPLAQDAAIFATHCAGPRVGDLAQAGALPRAVVSVVAMRRRTLLLSLTADSPFSGNGFSGRVTSDIRVRIKRDRRLEAVLRGTGGLTITGTDKLSTGP
jgi:hypothetical protein